MFLMYVDESGDCGFLSAGSPTKFYILSGMVLHELRWKEILEKCIDFRKRMRAKFNIPLREEIHAAEMISRRSKYMKKIRRNDRLAVLRHFIDEIATMREVNILNVVVDKQNKPADYDIFSMAWKAMLQRFENTIIHKNFPGPANPDDRGILFPDRTDDKKLRLLIRRMRRFNPVPSRFDAIPEYRDIPIKTIIEDPNTRNSADSYFIQAVDTVAFFLKQHIDPAKYMRRQGGKNYFLRLEPILCKHASSKDPHGIVWL